MLYDVCFMSLCRNWWYWTSQVVLGPCAFSGPFSCYAHNEHPLKQHYGITLWLVECAWTLVMTIPYAPWLSTQDRGAYIVVGQPRGAQPDAVVSVRICVHFSGTSIRRREPGFEEAMSQVMSFERIMSSNWGFKSILKIFVIVQRFMWTFFSTNFNGSEDIFSVRHTVGIHHTLSTDKNSAINPCR